MTQTLRRELRTRFEETLLRFADKLTIAERESLAEMLSDSALEVSGIARKANPPGLDWAILSGQPVTEEMIDRNKLTIAARNAFEQAFGFGTLPWDSGIEWERLSRFIEKIYLMNKDSFANYVWWREDEKGGKYIAMSNKQIRQFPQMFIDTGWPEFIKANQAAPKSLPGALEIH